MRESRGDFNDLRVQFPDETDNAIGRIVVVSGQLMAASGLVVYVPVARWATLIVPNLPFDGSDF